MAGEPVQFRLLLSVFNPTEIELLPQNVPEKLEALLESRDTIQDDLKTKLERLRVNSEQRYFELEKQLIDSRTKLGSSLGTISELKTQNAKLEEQLQQSKDELAGIRDSSEGSLLSTKQLTRTVGLLEYDKGELLKVLERRNQEIARLNDDWKSMSNKLAQANAAKCSLQVKVDELQNKDMSVKYREKRLEQEKSHLASQNEWLNQQVKKSSDELLTLRKDKSNQILELQGKVNELTDEMKHLQEAVEFSKKTIKEQEVRINGYMANIKENTDAFNKSENLFHCELAAQSKLTALYEKSAKEAQDKVRELITAVEELQKLLSQASTSQGELKNDLQQLDSDFTAKEIELNDKIAKMENELENANDLLEAARKKGISLKLSDEELNSLSPMAAAASSFLKSGLTLTQMYSEYVKSSDELQVEKAENHRLNSYLEQILAEIEEKAPVMQKQREDYEKSLQVTNQLSARLDGNLIECEQLRVTADEAERTAGMAAREIQRLKQQCNDLGQQVRVLLKEVYEARGGPLTSEDDVSSPDISSSSNVISEHLVSFRNIQELQAQNERLLTSLRELSDQKEQEEQRTVQSKTNELTLQLESAIKDIEEMREARVRQTDMVEAIVRQRDMYRVLLQQTGTTPLPAFLLSPSMPLRGQTKPVATPENKDFSEVVTSTPTASEEMQDLSAKEALKTLRGEFETYRSEKAENDRMLNEQLEKLRKEVSNFRVQNTQLASQLDFAGERYKILQSNVEGYKKEIASHRDKSHKYSTELVKNQQRVNSLTQDLMAANEKLTRAEVACDSLRTERDMLKGVESRLTQEKETIVREHRGQALLLTNLETIQNNLERSEFESKARLSNQMESMERELHILRRRLEGDNDQHRVVLKTWEGRVQGLQRQLNHELDNHQKTRDSLNKTKSDLQLMKEQCSSVEAQLVSALIKYESALKEKNELVAASSQQPVVVASNDEELRDLKSKLRMAEDQIKVLNDQVVKSKTHLDQYKSISTAIETSLKEQSDASQTYKETMETRLEETIQAREHLEKQVIELETELGRMRSEKEELTQAVASQTSELRRNLLRTQEELTVAVQQKAVAEATEATARQDCQDQARLSQEAQDKYEREFLLHAADVGQLVTLKKQLESQNTKQFELELAATTARTTLDSAKASWDEVSALQRRELEEQTAAHKALDRQNVLLHDQLQELSQRLMTSQETLIRGPHRPLDMTDGGSQNKSSEQLVEVIKFLRREKDIAETRSELAQSETIRLRQKCEHLEQQYEETRQHLTGERERTQVMAETTAQHHELLKKVETLNALTDSNRLLREEKDRLEQQVQQLEAKVCKLETDIQPLQEVNRNLLADREVLSTDKIGLTIEVTRWKQRTNHLIEQCNRADPEEQKRLVAEKDANKKTIGTLREETLRHKAEISRLNVQLGTARAELSRVNTELANVQSETKLEHSKLSEEINSLKTEITTKMSDINDKKNTIQQVKKIGRRYKSQFEELQAKVDSEKDQAGQPNLETQTKIKDLEEALTKVTEENKMLKETEDKTKVLMAEKDERDERNKRLMQTVQQKYTSDRNKQNEEKNRLQAQIDEMKGEVVALEALHAQSEDQLQADKRSLQERADQLEKDVQQAKEKQEKQQTIQNEEQQKQQQQKQELQARVQELEKQVEDQQKQLQVKHLAPQQPMGADRPNMRSEEPPPTANIKPISSPATTVTKTSTSSGQRITASVRPIAVTPVTNVSSSLSATPMATVMPQTQSEAGPVVTETERQQAVQEPLSLDTPIIVSVGSTTPIQAVTPTQQSVTVTYYPPRLDERSAESTSPAVQDVVRADNVQEVRAEPRVIPAPEPIAEVAPLSSVDMATLEPVVIAEPVVVEPVVAEPVIVDPIILNPVVIDSVVVDPVAMDPVAITPVVTAPVVVASVVEIPTAIVEHREDAIGAKTIEVDKSLTSAKRQRDETGEYDGEVILEVAHVEKRQRVTPQPAPEESGQSLPAFIDLIHRNPTDAASTQDTQLSFSPLGEDEAGPGLVVHIQDINSMQGGQMEKASSNVLIQEVPPSSHSEQCDAPPSSHSEQGEVEEEEEAVIESLDNLESQVEEEEDEEDDDDIVIVVDTDDEDLADDPSQDDEDIDEVGETVDYEEEEDYADEYPVEGDIDYGDAEVDMDDEEDDAISMEEQGNEDDGSDRNNDQNMDEEEDDEDDDGEDDDDDDDEVVEISEDEEIETAGLTGMEVGPGNQQEQVQPMEEHQTATVPMPELRVEPARDHVPTSQEQQEPQVERVPLQHVAVTRQRLASLGRPPMFLGAPFEDFGDDRQVPSTPTLFVPRRTDGFAEAINSPLLQGRFQFGSSEGEQGRSPAPGLAQLVSQGDLGMDDTRINLLGGDDDGGRSVPTTPLQTNAPGKCSNNSMQPLVGGGYSVNVLTSSPSSQARETQLLTSQDTSRSVPATTTSTEPIQQPTQQQSGGDEPDTLPTEVPEASLGTTTMATQELQGQAEGELQSLAGQQSDESIDVTAGSEEAEARNRSEQGTSETGQGERPKPKRIVWQDLPGGVAGQSQQQPQQQQRPRGSMAIRSRGRFIQRSFPRGAGPMNRETRERGGRFTR